MTCYCTYTVQQWLQLEAFSQLRYCFAVEVVPAAKDCYQHSGLQNLYELIMISQLTHCFSIPCFILEVDSLGLTPAESVRRFSMWL